MCYCCVWSSNTVVPVGPKIISTWCYTQTKDASYEVAMKSEKRDSGLDGDANGTSKFCDFGDDDDDDFVVDRSDLGSDDNDQSSPLDSTANSVANSPPQSPINASPVPQILINDKEKRRRSTTWQAKFERRRRKNSSNADDGGDEAQEPPANYNRQKRHSWWNILVPDNIKQRWFLAWLKRYPYGAHQHLTNNINLTLTITSVSFSKNQYSHLQNSYQKNRQTTFAEYKPNARQNRNRTRWRRAWDRLTGQTFIQFILRDRRCLRNFTFAPSSFITFTIEIVCLSHI